MTGGNQLFIYLPYLYYCFFIIFDAVNQKHGLLEQKFGKKSQLGADFVNYAERNQSNDEWELIL